MNENATLCFFVQMVWCKSDFRPSFFLLKFIEIINRGALCFCSERKHLNSTFLNSAWIIGPLLAIKRMEEIQKKHFATYYLCKRDQWLVNLTLGFNDGLVRSWPQRDLLWNFLLTKLANQICCALLWGLCWQLCFYLSRNNIMQGYIFLINVVWESDSQPEI